ncbi:nuclear transport factor 2 family protein [Candidatus Parcubacteria bacterium]|nr:nuclear transport factor 2 family protein [Candidatus Parcubacteria bacterium]
MATSRTDPKLEKAMRDSLKVYAAGNKRFFNYLQKDVRVYTLESSEPIVGRKAFESYFGPTFSKTKRKVAIVAKDVQLAGKQAILAQTLKITANGVSSYIRQTVIWERDTGEWKMSHIHNAMVGQPVIVGKPPRTPQSIRVLNERIATVAATVGMAQ